METKYIVFFILINIQIIQVADTSDKSLKKDDLETIIRNPKELGDRLFDMKNRNKFCDAEIIVGDKRIPVHKNVLASSSTFFETIFTKNESKAEFEMEDMTFDVVQSLIEYCYTGILHVSDQNLDEIIALATFLNITPIIEGSKTVLEKKVNSLGCISSWKFAKKEHFDYLGDSAFECIRQNYETVSQSSEFLDLDYSEILELLKSDIDVTSEVVVLNSVKKWINHDSASRKQYLDKLSNFIRFENLPKNILLSESRDLCPEDSSLKCHTKILNAQQQKEKNNFESADKSFRDSYRTLTAVGSWHFDRSKTFEIFDLRSEKWIKIENFECDRTEYSAVLLKHNLMLIGGKNKDGITVNTVQSYNLNTGSMKNLPSMKYARYRLTAVEFKGRVYAIGGYDGNTNILNVEMWDPVLKIWKETAPMSIPRYGCQVGVLDKEILLVGGYNYNTGKFLSDMESYNPVTDKWRKRTSMNEERHFPGVAVVDGYLYTVGGYSQTGYSKTAERYDPKIDKWTTIHSLEKTRNALGAANLFGKLVVVGGRSSDGVMSTMEMYDDRNDKWISKPSLNDPRYFLNAVEIPWKLAMATLSREIPK